MLSAIEVRAAKAKEKVYKLSDGKGLHLAIYPNGKKTWLYRYELAGKESLFTIGGYPEISLELARKERAACRELVKQGISPADERRAKKEANLQKRETVKKSSQNSFQAVAEEWLNQQQDRWSATHTKATRLSLQQNVYPFIGTIQVDQIQPPQIIEILRRIEGRGALEIASKTLQKMSAVFRYAVQTGNATHNPASEMRGVLKARKVKHYCMINPEDLPAFLQALNSATDLNINTRLAVYFTILTAVRSGEVRFATWAEINLEKCLWSIPANRMKMRVPHTVPLSKQAIAVLLRMKALHGDKGLIFPGTKNEDQPLSENTMLYAIYRLGYHSRTTIHGFRALFSTIANEAGFNPDAIERQLAHREKNAVRAAYHRSEYFPERQKLMQWWADHLYHLEHGAEIIPIGRKVNE